MSGVDSVGADGQPRFCGEPYVTVTEPTVVEEARDALAATLREILGYLPDPAKVTAYGPLGLTKVVDGTPLVRTPWIGPRLVTRWRAVLDEHGGIPRPDVADHGDPVGEALRQASR